MPPPTTCKPQTVFGEPHEHTPPSEVATQLSPGMHWCPQLPQLLGSNAVSVQTPEQHAVAQHDPPQSVSPAEHEMGIVVVVVVELVVVVVVVIVVEVPQTFGAPPPPQVSGSAHVPQSSVRPAQSPSAIVPQLAPAAWHVVGVQHLPNGVVPLTHTPVQQLLVVRHD
ncbi:MAG TPA: hypothetical protein VKU61_01515 [Candidatus Binatia bacterium]|nr:hypothetical protein [Candidatus Binatia bacterium]